MRLAGSRCRPRLVVDNHFPNNRMLNSVEWLPLVFIDLLVLVIILRFVP